MEKREIHPNISQSIVAHTKGLARLADFDGAVEGWYNCITQDSSYFELTGDYAEAIKQGDIPLMDNMPEHMEHIYTALTYKKH